MNVDETDALLRSVETQQQLTILTEALLRAVPELEGTLRDVIEENHTPGETGCSGIHFGLEQFESRNQHCPSMEQDHLPILQHDLAQVAFAHQRNVSNCRKLS